MERVELMNKALAPVDMAFEGLIELTKKADIYRPFADGVIEGMKKAMTPLFKNMYGLELIDAHNLPTTGGAVLAINHQSWNDVQVVSATCPRIIRWIAKSEFKHWPMLRHLIDLSGSVFIERGGDDGGLKSIADALKSGEVIGIFPEGTIPGEEDIPRWDVEPDTGLLRGRSGAVRLAAMAGVPIIPVGVSGTGKAMPPETYPRLQALPPTEPVKVTIKYGKPISVSDIDLETVSRDELRERTHEVMKAISSLVDFSRHYEPITVPIQVRTEPRKEPNFALRSAPRKAKGKAQVGVLVVHGFTSSISCVSPLEPALKTLKVPYRFPILRGHGTKYQDLEGVTWQDWYDDAEDAMLDLLKECEQVILIGHSMGGAVILDLAAHHDSKVAGVIPVAPALKFADPLAGLTSLIAKVIKEWPSPDAYTDAECRKSNDNYPKFMTSSFVSLYEYASIVTNRLSFVRAPLHMIHTKQDTVVSPSVAKVVMDKASSKVKSMTWFEESGHEMFKDLERDAVVDAVRRAIQKILASL